MGLTDGSVHHDKSDPIFNFLFEYYHFKPRMLLQWTPGFDVYLLDADPSLKGILQTYQRIVGLFFYEMGVLLGSGGYQTPRQAAVVFGRF